MGRRQNREESIDSYAYDILSRCHIKGWEGTQGDNCGLYPGPASGDQGSGSCNAAADDGGGGEDRQNCPYIRDPDTSARDRGQYQPRGHRRPQRRDRHDKRDSNIADMDEDMDAWTNGITHKIR